MATKRSLVIFGLVGLLAVALLSLVPGEAAHIHTFMSPLSPFYVYMPLIVKQLDPRFGIAEYNCTQFDALGFPHDGRYHGEQWGMPHCDEACCNTVFWSRTDHRCLNFECAQPVPDSWPTDLYCLFGYEIDGHLGNCTGEVATSTGLINPVGLCEFLHDHPDISIIVGNEEIGPGGISDDVTPQEYAAWYREVWETVKSPTCQPSVRVGPYAPMHAEAAKPYLLAFWEAYGEPLPMDFMAIHHYAWPEYTLQDEIDSLLSWLVWLDNHIDTPEWWLTEYGMPCWEPYCPNEGPEVERFMEEFTCWMVDGQEFQSWAWWSDCWLYRDGQPTAAGELYLELAKGGCE